MQKYPQFKNNFKNNFKKFQNSAKRFFKYALLTGSILLSPLRAWEFRDTVLLKHDWAPSVYTRAIEGDTVQISYRAPPTQSIGLYAMRLITRSCADPNKSEIFNIFLGGTVLYPQGNSEGKPSKLEIDTNITAEYTSRIADHTGKEIKIVTICDYNIGASLQNSGDTVVDGSPHQKLVVYVSYNSTNSGVTSVEWEGSGGKNGGRGRENTITELVFFPNEEAIRQYMEAFFKNGGKKLEFFNILGEYFNKSSESLKDGPSPKAGFYVVRRWY